MKKDPVRSLLDFELFETLDEQAMDLLKRSGGISTRTLQEGAFLEPPKTDNRLLCIVSGTLDIEQVSLSGGLFIVEQFTRGACIGANAVFLEDEKRPPMQIYAKEKTHMISIDREALFAILKRDSECLYKYLELMSKRSLMLTQKVNALSSKPLRDKILEYLQGLYAAQRTNPVWLPTTKKRLAHMLSVERTSLSRRLKALEDEGCITVEGRSVTLHDDCFRQ